MKTAFLLACPLFALISISSPSQEPATDLKGKEDKQIKEERMVIGPFKLGSLFSDMDHSSFFSDEHGPTKKAIIDAFNECNLYIIERKSLKNGHWILSDSPRPALEGQLSFTLKDKAGKDFTIQLLKVYRAGSFTNNLKKPAYRGFPVGLSIRATSQTLSPALKQLAMELSKIAGKELNSTVSLILVD
jgi:hypothetical protein